MIDATDIYLAICFGLVGLLILFIVLDAKKRFTGRMRRDRTQFNTIYPKR